MKPWKVHLETEIENRIRLLISGNSNPSLRFSLFQSRPSDETTLQHDPVVPGGLSDFAYSCQMKSFFLIADASWSLFSIEWLWHGRQKDSFHLALPCPLTHYLLSALFFLCVLMSINPRIFTCFRDPFETGSAPRRKSLEPFAMNRRRCGIVCTWQKRLWRTIQKWQDKSGRSRWITWLERKKKPSFPRLLFFLWVYFFEEEGRLNGTNYGTYMSLIVIK